MRSKEVPIEQQIINKINAKVDFIYPATTKHFVCYETLHYSNNPSLKYEDIYKDIYSIIEKDIAIKGYLHKKSGVYTVYMGILN